MSLCPVGRVVPRIDLHDGVHTLYGVNNCKFMEIYDIPRLLSHSHCIRERWYVLMGMNANREGGGSLGV